jgi:alkylation response protein AidB-like acyl-CoA dehydrogenase
MNFALAEDQRRWVEEVRRFLADEVGPAQLEAVRQGGGEWGGEANRQFRAKLLERGWLSLTWPTRYGGAGRSTTDQLLMMDELAYVGAPSIDMTAASVAPTMMRCGTPEQLDRWLPAIRQGSVEFAIGYSEPDSGSDLASVRTSAAFDGYDWVINGQKIWNTGAEYCTHEWLLCRTMPEAPRHRGLSVLVVPLNSAGVTVREITTWRGLRINQVWFDDVRVPADHLFGESGGGWRYVTQALGFERLAIGITGGLRRLLDDLVHYCRSRRKDGRRLIDDALIQHRLAGLATDVELARLLNYRAGWAIDQSDAFDAQASMSKVFTTDLHARAATTALEVLGPGGRIDPHERGVMMGGRAQLMYRAAPYLRFGGGTNEIQRDIVAQRGFGLPR